MEVQELQCYRLSKNFSPLNTSDICSRDNDFTTLVLNGAHIMSLSPNLINSEENCKVQRSIIKPPSEYLPAFRVDFNTLNRKKFCMLSLDWKHTPILDKFSPAGMYIRQIGFIDSEPPAKPLLGVVNNQGYLELYRKCRYDWEKVIDISSVWNNHWLSQWSEYQIDDYDTKTKKIKCLQIISFTHCPGFVFDEEKKSSLLISISQNGMAAFWKIENEKVSLINFVDLGIFVSSLHWHYLTNRFGWLIAACFDGSVKIYFCKKNASNEIVPTLLHELWKETDQAAASNLKVCKQGSRSLLVFSKENALLVFALQKNQIGSFRHEFDKKIAGLEILDDSCIFVILKDHQTYNLSIKNEKCVCVPIPFKTNSSFKKYNIHGVSFSKNKVFCVITMGIGENFDAMINKEPYCVLLCTTKNEISFSTMETLIKELSPYQAFDYIEYFRLSCSKKKTQVPVEILTNLESIVKENIGDCYRDIQAIFILSLCCRYNQPVEDLFDVEILFIISCFIHHSQSITDSRRHYYFQQWLSANFQKLPKFLAEHQQIRNIVDKASDSNGYIAEEKCEICLSAITDHSSNKFIVCHRGHKVLRCNRSFLPITLQPHHTCSICHSIILKSEDVLQCVVCGNIL